ncbi:MAG: DUF2891 domain-containing protein [Bacteroidales bacterium]|nr:DUF2891 domain-containing protein [Bacteroidales bacterium]MBN2698509.1 DUF2891 domain-containing protein [Bacteroidales bacterium]
MKTPISILLLSLMILTRCKSPVPPETGRTEMITFKEASSLATPALQCIQKPYPYKPGHVLTSDSSLIPHRELHPAFFGCFDWHSSVHGHWTLVKLLKMFPDLPEENEIRDKLSQNITDKNVLKELEFFYSPENTTYERTYGWAWLLKLQLELLTWEDPSGNELAANLQPLADSLIKKYLDFLSVLPYPIRVGEHTNTAFGLSFAWDYADAMQVTELKTLIKKRSEDFYLNDTGCPINWEPSGFDFLSPCLMEADLMGRILNGRAYVSWIKSFLPELFDNRINLIEPAMVTARSDPKIVHLDGLNFSRAWCLFRIDNYLDNAYPQIAELAFKHLEASLPYITSGNYEGEHWLASFAVYALESGILWGNINN